MPDADHTETLQNLYDKMIYELPYDLTSNRAICDALIWGHLAENPDKIEHFVEIISDFEPEFYPSWFNPDE